MSNDERSSFIKGLLEEGKRYDEVRRELISQGHSTESFESVYQEIATEMGIKEPPPKVPEGFSHIQYEAAQPTEDLSDVDMPDAISMLRHGVSLTISRWQAVVYASVLTIFANLVLVLVPTQPSLYLDGVFLIALIIIAVLSSILASIVAVGALIFVIVRDDEVSYYQGLQWALGRFFSILWLSIVGGLITLTGFVAFIIPALIFTVYSIFSFVALVREDARGITAIVRSTDLVYGQFWRILGRIGIVALVLVACGLVVGLVGGLFLSVVNSFGSSPALALIPTTFFTLTQMVFTAAGVGALMKLYVVQAAHKPVFDLGEYRSLSWVYRIAALIGFFIPAGLVFYLGVTVASFINQFEMIQTTSSGSESSERARENRANEPTFDDYVLRSKVATTQASVRVTAGRLGSYDGICGNVTLEPPIQCTSTDKTYMLQAPLSDGTFYCVDSEGYADVNPQFLRGEISCQ